MFCQVNLDHQSALLVQPYQPIKNAIVWQVQEQLLSTYLADVVAIVTWFTSRSRLLFSQWERGSSQDRKKTHWFSGQAECLQVSREHRFDQAFDRMFDKLIRG
ncbi:hypothetical protein OSTOST_09162 [Ostertagia ostertagi]